MLRKTFFSSLFSLCFRSLAVSHHIEKPQQLFGYSSKPYSPLCFSLMTFIKSLCETTGRTPKASCSILWVCTSWSKLCWETIIEALQICFLFPPMQHREEILLQFYSHWTTTHLSFSQCLTNGAKDLSQCGFKCVNFSF